MADLLIIEPSNNIPMRLHGSGPGVTIRRLAQPEQLGIEDYLHEQVNEEIELKGKYAAIAILDVPRDTKEVSDYVTVVEFALSMIAQSGNPSPLFSAIFEKGKCIGLKRLRRFTDDIETPKYQPSLRGTTVSQWIATCLAAYRKSQDRVHITMHRFNRYARSSNLADRLMDLAISLESLLENQTEVSFRFSVVLTRSVDKRAEEAIKVAELLAELYTLRSKLAHGDPGALKLMKKIRNRIAELHRVSREILTNYIFYISTHSRTDWNMYLKERLYS